MHYETRVHFHWVNLWGRLKWVAQMNVCIFMGSGQLDYWGRFIKTFWQGSPPHLSCYIPGFQQSTAVSQSTFHNFTWSSRFHPSSERNRLPSVHCSAQGHSHLSMFCKDWQQPDLHPQTWRTCGFSSVFKCIYEEKPMTYTWPRSQPNSPTRTFFALSGVWHPWQVPFYFNSHFLRPAQSAGVKPTQVSQTVQTFLCVSSLMLPENWLKWWTHHGYALFKCAVELKHTSDWRKKGIEMVNDVPYDTRDVQDVVIASPFSIHVNHNFSPTWNVTYTLPHSCVFYPKYNERIWCGTFLVVTTHSGTTFPFGQSLPLSIVVCASEGAVHMVAGVLWHFDTEAPPKTKVEGGPGQTDWKLQPFAFDLCEDIYVHFIYCISRFWVSNPTKNCIDYQYQMKEAFLIHPSIWTLNKSWRSLGMFWH